MERARKRAAKSLKEAVVAAGLTRITGRGVVASPQFLADALWRERRYRVKPGLITSWFRGVSSPSLEASYHLRELLGVAPSLFHPALELYEPEPVNEPAAQEAAS